jgi:hypothetical protein
MQTSIEHTTKFNTTNRATIAIIYLCRYKHTGLRISPYRLNQRINRIESNESSIDTSSATNMTKEPLLCLLGFFGWLLAAASSLTTMASSRKAIQVTIYSDIA